MATAQCVAEATGPATRRDDGMTATPEAVTPKKFVL
jgi:hypothetical protein